MSLVIEKNDNRFYIVGQAFNLKEAIKSLGCRFDSVKKQWYASNMEIAKKVISLDDGKESSKTVAKINYAISTTAPIIIGRAKYRGHEYFILSDSKKAGKHQIKLVYKDGSKVFWASRVEDVQMLVKYRLAKSIVNLHAFEKWSSEVKKIFSEETIVVSRAA